MDYDIFINQGCYDVRKTKFVWEVHSLLHTADVFFCLFVVLFVWLVILRVETAYGDSNIK